MKLDAYIVDTLMRDVVGHDRSASAYLVYLQLYRHAGVSGDESVRISHAGLADLTGLSKRAVQNGVDLLERRGLIIKTLASPTSTPTYRVVRPWRIGRGE